MHHQIYRLEEKWLICCQVHQRMIVLKGETTAYVDDFEGSQTTIDLRSPLAWSMSSVPLEFVPNGQLYGSAPDDPDNLLNGYGRTKMAWYTIDPIFYGPQRPSEISNAGYFFQCYPQNLY